ncbi:uncharacterized protein [Watersipora subatra]|uniref:uncharacterized protein n=1 Tax=Watersipora subatra TaxID=2589382 RepID=UPI00355C2265
MSGNSARSFMDLPNSVFRPMLENSLLMNAMTRHCEFIEPMVSCMERKLPEFCLTTHEEIITEYIEPLKMRYCTGIGVDSAQVSQTVYSAMVGERDAFMDEVACFVDLTNTDSFEFNMEKIEKMYSEMLNRCDFDNIFFRLTSIAEDTRGEILSEVQELIRVARSPMRCVVKVVGEQCPSIDMSAVIDKILVHVNRATAGVLNVDKEYFISTQQVNYGSKERVSMWVVGDPHIRILDGSKFTYCQADGLTTYFLSEEGTRFELKGKNVAANEFTNATVLKEIYFKVWAPGAAYTDASVLNYTIKDGAIKPAFDSGETDVVVGQFSIFIETRDNGKTVVIQNVNSGTFIAIQGFNDFFNMVMRTSRSYAETATGLLIAGCGSSAVDITELNANAAVTSESDSRRRKRSTVTFDECQAACLEIPEILREECTYDCFTLEDLQVGEAHSGAIAVEEVIVEDDVKITIWLPDLDETTTVVAPSSTDGTDSSAGHVLLSTTCMLLTSLLLVR